MAYSVLHLFAPVDNVAVADEADGAVAQMGYSELLVAQNSEEGGGTAAGEALALEGGQTTVVRALENVDGVHIGSRGVRRLGRHWRWRRGPKERELVGAKVHETAGEEGGISGGRCGLGPAADAICDAHGIWAKEVCILADLDGEVEFWGEGARGGPTLWNAIRAGLKAIREPGALHGGSKGSGWRQVREVGGKGGGWE